MTRSLPVIVTLVGTAVLVAVLALLELRGPAPRDTRGIPPCPVGADERLLDPAALECWFKATRGLWRTRSRVWVHGVLLVNVDAANVRDAEEIARRFVEERGSEFREIVVYVREDRAPATAPTRRVTWTPTGGMGILDF